MMCAADEGDPEDSQYSAVLPLFEQLRHQLRTLHAAVTEGRHVFRRWFRACVHAAGAQVARPYSVPRYPRDAESRAQDRYFFLEVIICIAFGDVYKLRVAPTPAQGDFLCFAKGKSPKNFEPGNGCDPARAYAPVAGAVRIRHVRVLDADAQGPCPRPFGSCGQRPVLDVRLAYGAANANKTPVCDGCSAPYGEPERRAQAFGRVEPERARQDDGACDHPG